MSDDHSQRPPEGLPRTSTGAPVPLRVRIMAWCLVAIGCLVCLELVARVLELVSPPAAVDRTLGLTLQSRLFVPAQDDPDQLVTAPEKAAISQRFARQKPDGVYRVAVVGGSSVRELSADLEQLGGALGNAIGRRVEVINAGVSSFGSGRVRLVVRELLDCCEPDLMVLYTGHNEFEEVRQIKIHDDEWSWLGSALDHSAAFRLVRDLVLSHRVEMMREELDRLNKDPEPNREAAWAYPFEPADIEPRMAAFEDHVRAIVTRIDAAGVPLVMATVASNWLAPVLPPHIRHRSGELEQLLARGDIGGATRLARELLVQSAGRHQASDLENAIIRRIAEQTGHPLVDVEAAVTARGDTRPLFRDHCHLNRQGRQIWVQTMLPTLVQVAGRR